MRGVEAAALCSESCSYARSAHNHNAKADKVLLGRFVKHDTCVGTCGMCVMCL